MKKLLFLATGLITLASCSENDFVGDEAVVKSQQEEGMITFSTATPAITRAEYTGAKAAEKLNNQFVVGGFKGAESVATNTVFDNYNVEYTQNTANKTESNTHNWEYVGLQPNALASIPHESGDKQTIKYWDYSQEQYDFIAYSLGTGGATATRITPSTATNSDGGAYTISGTTAKLKTVHIADLKTVLKADYNQVVNLNFRSMTAKVRIGLYETIPGYSVKDVKFYSTADGTSSTTAALYATSSVLPTEGTYTVYFPTVNDKTPTTDKNKAHVAFTTVTSKQANQTFGSMTKLVQRQKYEYNSDDKKDLLGRTSNTASFAQGSSDDNYVDVLPLEDGTSLTLKVDYTLISIDGSSETINVKGATAVVPQIYAQWKPGYAYTYLFKISDNTNGTTGIVGTDLNGLYPITFDAVVVNAEEDATQETITTVSTPSITTYQKGSAVVKNDEYLTTTGDIYIQVMDNSGATPPLKNDLDTKGQLWKLNSGTTLVTEASFMDAINLPESVNGNVSNGRNGLVVENITSTALSTNVEAVPGADGNDIDVTAKTTAKFTPSEGTYAFLYEISDKTDSYYYVPINVATQPTDWDNNYFEDAEGTKAATTFTANTTYYKKYTNLNKVYAVKVIKVVAATTPVTP